MAYAILRVKKLKTYHQVLVAGKHNARKVEVPNADPTKTIHRLVGSDSPLEAYKQKVEELSIKERKDGVPAFELLCTYSPEATHDMREWAKATKAHLIAEYGRDRILSMHLHLDEKTPHIHCIVMPLVQKKDVWKLVCKDFLGHRDKLIGMQDRYADAMKPFGLERGIRNSKATHQKVKRFYGELKGQVEAATKEVDAMKEPSILNFKKVTSILKEHLKTALVAAAKMDKLQDAYDGLKIKVTGYQKQLSDISKSAKGLTPAEIERVLEWASAGKAAKTAEKERVNSEELARRYAQIPVAPVLAAPASKLPPKAPESPVKPRVKTSDASLSMS